MPTPDRCHLTAYRLHEHDTFLKIVPAPADRFWMDFTTHGWANRCLPLRIANQAGWHVLNNSKFEVEWNGKPEVDAVTINFLDGRPSRFVKSNFGFGILTWYLPYLFRTSPGYNLLVRGPANMPKDGISPIEGLVETDWVEGTFSVNWKITRPFMKIRFDNDDPICMLVPQRRVELEMTEPTIRNLESNPELFDGYKEWIASRRAFVSQVSANPPKKDEPRPWQGHYTRGTHVSGETAPTHQTKLQLRPFEQKEAPLRQPGSLHPVAALEAANSSSTWSRVKQLLRRQT
jgi:hypothetical protein